MSLFTILLICILITIVIGCVFGEPLWAFILVMEFLEDV